MFMSYIATLVTFYITCYIPCFSYYIVKVAYLAASDIKCIFHHDSTSQMAAQAPGQAESNPMAMDKVSGILGGAI